MFEKVSEILSKFLSLIASLWLHLDLNTILTFSFMYLLWYSSTGLGILTSYFLNIIYKYTYMVEYSL